MAVILGAFVGLARAVAVRWVRIPDDDPYLDASIAPTLFGGDLVILWRFTAPHYGDLVLCPEPRAPERSVIARIVATEGDHVVVEGSTIHLNGRRIHTEGSCPVTDFSVIDPVTDQEVDQTCSTEELGDRIHPRGNVKGGRPPITVEGAPEEGELFLVSDNRQFPYDSRDFGVVAADTCKESVIFRIVGATGFTDVESRFAAIR